MKSQGLNIALKFNRVWTCLSYLRVPFIMVILYKFLLPSVFIVCQPFRNFDKIFKKNIYDLRYTIKRSIKRFIEENLF